MDTTSRLNLPMILPSQAQKHVTHNEGLGLLDAIVQLSALSRTLSAPPPAPAEGDVYIVPAGGTWPAAANSIAAFDAGGWHFLAPRPGWRAFVFNESDLLVFADGNWSSLLKLHREGGSSLPFFGIAASANETTRLTVASAASLFTHQGADVRLTVNKPAPTKTASLVFQTNYSGRAEIGTVGSDSLSVKTSADGMTWTTALTVDSATGRVGVGPGTPTCALDVNGNLGRVAGPSFAAWAVAATGAGGREYRLAATDDSNGLGGGKFVLYDQTGGAVRLVVSAAALESMAPVKVPAFSKASLPSAAVSGPGAIIYVPDAVAGAVLAYSDGAAWRRSVDRAIVA